MFLDVTFKVFPVPEPLRLGPGEPTVPPAAAVTACTEGEETPEEKNIGVREVKFTVRQKCSLK